jgi:hypothetical protein
MENVTWWQARVYTGTHTMATLGLLDQLFNQAKIDKRK